MQSTQPNHAERKLRTTALHLAVQHRGGDVVAIAERFLNFLKAGDTTVTAEKPKPVSFGPGDLPF